MIDARFILACAAIFILQSCGNNASEPAPVPTRKELSIKHAFEEDFRRTYDPALGYPPKERLILALKEIEKINKEMAGRRSAGVDNPRFAERGPINIGGRTRTILIDRNDPSGKTVWAGSVSGGLWKTNDITEDPPQWIVVNDYLANLAVGSMAQDPNNPQIMYLGTGEGFPNFEAVRGIGIFKSTDGGDTWDLLSSTDNTIFRFTRDLLVHPVTSHVYAATREGGVRRSEDGGNTWLKVLGVALAASDDSMFDLAYAGGKLFASNSTNIYSSETGDRGLWQSITQNNSNFPTNLSRVEFTVCSANPLILYAVGSLNGGASNIYRTSTGGTTWASLDPPTGGDFTNGQAWYDLEIAVDPYNCDHVIAGGVGIYRTLNGGLSWNSFRGSMHVDQHKVVFDPDRRDVIYFGNDGGVYRSENGTNSSPVDKNLGYITTQYYGCAMHPDSFSNYFLGGTQDNGTHRLNGVGVAHGTNVWGGDGFYCHIDEYDPRIQMVSSQFGNWGLSMDGGNTFSGGQSTNGGFVNPSDYDSRTKMLYTQTSSADFMRWNVITNVIDPVDIIALPGGVTAVHVDDNVDNRVYFGMGNGNVIRVDNANEGLSVPGTVVLMSGAGTISGIDVLRGNRDRIIVSKSNYGINNIYVTSDGGGQWTVCDGNLPDMPVRDVVFNPRNGDQAMIATEAGVWTTAFLDGNNTMWMPPAPGRGTPITRTDDLEVRYSDNVVLAATHGRGLWTTSVFADPRARFFVPLIHYIHAPVQFYGDLSLNADTFQWLFGDGKTSTLVNPQHVYNAIGEYDITLTINNSLSVSDRIKILPESPLPWVKSKSYHGGSFDSHPEQYGVHTISGSGFELGNSTVPGKNGTRSGANAYVVGLNEAFYQANSESYLYLPVFDFSQPSIYTFSFWAKYQLHPGPDGFLVEYSTDRGQNWRALGSTADPKWYNHDNGQNNSGFPPGTQYFTGTAGAFTNFTRDLTFLTGQSEVAFRFVFRSEATGNHVGLAIDDVEIISFEGDLRTTLTTFTGGFGVDKNIDLRWTTLPEYYCRRFDVERSVNGLTYEVIDQVYAKSILSSNPTTYTLTTSGGGDLYFYRLRVLSENISTGYSYEFYSDVVTVRRNANEPVRVFTLYPNPVVDHINITFTDVVDQTVVFHLYDAAGKSILSESVFVNSPFHQLQIATLPPAVYYLSVQIGAQESKVFRLLSLGS